MVIPVEVVGSDVEQHRHVDTKLVGGVELEAGDLEHQRVRVALTEHVAHRRADVPRHHHIHARGLQDVADDAHRGRLAVGSGHADDARTGVVKRELHLADDGNTAR
jgi:hypothetical protein